MNDFNFDNMNVIDCRTDRMNKIFDILNLPIISISNMIPEQLAVMEAAIENADIDTLLAAMNDKGFATEEFVKSDKPVTLFTLLAIPDKVDTPWYEEVVDEPSNAGYVTFPSIFHTETVEHQTTPRDNEFGKYFDNHIAPNYDLTEPEKKTARLSFIVNCGLIITDEDLDDVFKDKEISPFAAIQRRLKEAYPVEFIHKYAFNTNKKL